MDSDTSPDSSPPCDRHEHSFAYPPDDSLPAAAELEYLTHTAFLVIQNQPVPEWMRTHIAANFRADIDIFSSPSWDEHVRKFQAMGRMHPARHRITNLITDVDETKAHADVFCHMEATSVPANIKRLGMAQLRWKRHPLDGRWQLLHITGMREPPSDLHGDITAAPKLF